MEAGGGLFDEQPEIQAGEVSMPGNDGCASSVSSEPAVSVKKVAAAAGKPSTAAAAVAQHQKGWYSNPVFLIGTLVQVIR